VKPPRHRRKRAKPSPRELALLAWVELQMQDPVAARLALRVIGMHAALVAWMRDAEHNHVLPDPFRLPGDERVGGVSVGGMVSGTREPDDRMMRLVEDRLTTIDPEGLDPVRQRLTHRLGELAGWYVEVVGEVDVVAWEPLAVRLGDLIGDQVAANALATCCWGHCVIARHAGLSLIDPTGGWKRAHKNARERWRRLVKTYLVVLKAVDDQPTKGRRTSSGRVQVESVGPDGERRIG
jgi:hypothetical protein